MRPRLKPFIKCLKFVEPRGGYLGPKELVKNPVELSKNKYQVGPIQKVIPCEWKYENDAECPIDPLANPVSSPSIADYRRLL